MQLSMKTKNNSWLGGKKNDPVPQQEYKVSGWAQKAMEENTSVPVKFAPLDKKGTDASYGRQEQ